MMRIIGSFFRVFAEALPIIYFIQFNTRPVLLS